MPLFCWTSLCTAILMIFAMPPLTVATLLLAARPLSGMHFFTDDLGGNMMNYVNLFWLFGHPEVYILILPAFGVYSEVISAFSSKELYGYTSLVIATMAIAVLSFTVWLHHFFTMGQSAEHQRGVRHRHHGDRHPDRGQDLRLDLDHVPRRGALHPVDAVLDRLHDDIRARRLQPASSWQPRRSTTWCTTRCSSWRISTTCSSPGCSTACLPATLLVSQGFRLPADRALGQDLRRLLGGRLLSGLHAALCARRRRHGAADAGDFRARPSAPGLLVALVGASCCSPGSPPCSSSFMSASATVTPTACPSAIRGTPGA